MALLDLLGRRWTLRIVWELRDGALTSRALRAACDDASPTVMQQRLSELREAGLAAMGDGGGYALTALGEELFALFMPLHQLRRIGRSGRTDSSVVATGLVPTTSIQAMPIFSWH